MKNTPKWSQHGSHNREQIDQKQGPKIDAKKGTHARRCPEGRWVGRAATSIVLNIYKRLFFASKRLNVPLLSLAPLSLHTSSFDVPSPDVNLKGPAQTADPKLFFGWLSEMFEKLLFIFIFWKFSFLWKIIKNLSDKAFQPNLLA